VSRKLESLENQDLKDLQRDPKRSTHLPRSGTEVNRGQQRSRESGRPRSGKKSQVRPTETRSQNPSSTRRDTVKRTNRSKNPTQSNRHQQRREPRSPQNTTEPVQTHYSSNTRVCSQPSKPRAPHQPTTNTAPDQAGSQKTHCKPQTTLDYSPDTLTSNHNKPSATQHILTNPDIHHLVRTNPHVPISLVRQSVGLARLLVLVNLWSLCDTLPHHITYQRHTNKPAGA
jgi:hypothetical protein